MNYGSLSTTYDSLPTTKQQILPAKYYRKKSLPYIFISIFLIISSLTFYFAVQDKSSSSITSLSDDTNLIKRPNFVFIMLDDFMWRYMYDHDSNLLEYHPNIKSLLNTGVNVTHYYSQQMCNPARAAYLTGKYPIHIGFQRVGIVIDTVGSIDLSVSFLPEVLKKYSYNTHLLGKWHVGHSDPNYLPTARGFDTYLGYLGQSESYWTKTSFSFKDFMQSNTSCYSHYNGSILNDFSSYLYRDEAIKILNKYKSSSITDPFYLHLAFQATHSPFTDTNYEDGIPPSYIDPDILMSIKNNVLVRICYMMMRASIISFIVVVVVSYFLLLI
jgi:hypothetical protein